MAGRGPRLQAGAMLRSPDEKFIQFICRKLRHIDVSWHRSFPSGWRFVVVRGGHAVEHRVPIVRVSPQLLAARGGCNTRCQGTSRRGHGAGEKGEPQVAANLASKIRTVSHL